MQLLWSAVKWNTRKSSVPGLCLLRRTTHVTAGPGGGPCRGPPEKLVSELEFDGDWHIVQRTRLKFKQAAVKSNRGSSVHLGASSSSETPVLIFWKELSPVSSRQIAESELTLCVLRAQGSSFITFSWTSDLFFPCIFLINIKMFLYF